MLPQVVPRCQEIRAELEEWHQKLTDKGQAPKNTSNTRWPGASSQEQTPHRISLSQGAK